MSDYFFGICVLCRRRSECRYSRNLGSVCVNTESCASSRTMREMRDESRDYPMELEQDRGGGGPKIEILETQCVVCAKPEVENVCARCEHARYCSVECQREDWESGRHVDACYDALTNDPDELCAEVHCDLELNRHLLSEGEYQIGTLIVELNDHEEALEWLRLNRGHISAGLAGAYPEAQPIDGLTDLFKSKRTKNKEKLKAKQKEVKKRRRQLQAAEEDLKEAEGRRGKDKQKGKKGLLGKLKTLFRGKKGKKGDDDSAPPPVPQRDDE